MTTTSAHASFYALPPVQLDHIARMSDSTGIFQHAIFNVPNFHEGYCTDDNARAFILCNQLDELGSYNTARDLDRLATSYLAFLAAAFNPATNRFRNFMSHSRVWLEESGSEDSHARAIWAVGHGAGRSHNAGYRRLCGQLFERGLSIVESFSSPRAWAFALLGIHEYLRRASHNEQHVKQIIATRKLLTDQLVRLWNQCAREDWPWFEPSVTYDNMRLSQALLLSGQWMPDPKAFEIGLTSLRWLSKIQTSGDDGGTHALNNSDGHFRPIGSNGFYTRNGTRADFDQQPVEVHAMVAACLEAYRATRDASWAREARRAFDWFMGRNDLGLPLYDSTTGGCGDGLHADRVNQNQGAESTLAFHLSLAEMNYAKHFIDDSLHPII